MAVYLDDGFYDHPKALAAGEDACDLYVRGLAYCARNNTKGAIPRDALTRLTARRKRRDLAARLVAVPPGFDFGLWEETPGGWMVHDYAEFNQAAIDRRERGRKAAKVRWDSQRNHNSTSKPREGVSPSRPTVETEHAASGTPSNGKPADHSPFASMPEHDFGDAGALPEQCGPNAYPQPQPQPQPLEPDNHSQVVVIETHEEIHKPVDDDDDRKSVINQALALLAERDLTRREAEKGPVGDRAAWLNQAVERRRTRHAASLAGLETAETWADLSLAHFLDATPRAPTPVAESPAHFQRPPCDTCSGSGMVLDGAFAQPCPQCNA
jgi:hypothetical protein